MVEAVLAAFFSSERVLVFPLMVTYLGSNPRSTSTPSSRVGRSRRWPTVAFTSYPEPRYFPMVLALVGDSTMTSAPRPPPPAAPSRPALEALARGFALPPLGAAGLGVAFFTARLGRVAMSGV